MEVDIVEDRWVCGEAWRCLGEVMKDTGAFLRHRCEIDICKSTWTVDILFGWMRGHVDSQIVAGR